MNILILGGTGFLGPHTVEYALSRGHRLTLFNRGKTRPELFPQVEKLRGDRDPAKGDGLKALDGRTWDAVIDTSAYIPSRTRASSAALAKACKFYVLVSTMSVYGDVSKPGMDETSPVATLPKPDDETLTPETYGALKYLCEREVERAMPGRVACVRPSLIVGPGDPTDRFTYWVWRTGHAGGRLPAEVLSPGDPAECVQFIDVRDLGRWLVTLVEDGHAGVFNALGPKGTLTMQEFLHGCKVVTGSRAEFRWASDAFLEKQGIAAWTDMPMWVTSAPDSRGMQRARGDRAWAMGLTLRPAGDTIRDTWQWCGTRPEDYRFRAGLTPQREAEALRALGGNHG